MSICTTFTTCVKSAFYSLSPESLCTMVLMRKDILYECVKTYVMKRKEDPYAFFTPSLRTRKFNFSCCDFYNLFIFCVDLIQSEVIWELSLALDWITPTRKNVN